MPKRHFLLVHSRIGYELQGFAYSKAGLKMPPSVQRNLEAIRAWSVDLMTDNVRRMLKIELEKNPQQPQEPNMENKTGKGQEAVEKAGRQSVSQYYLEVFELQHLTKLPDEQIADEIERKSGSRPTKKNISSYRNAYNNSRLPGQHGIPKVKLKAVRPPSKAKPKKPMSAETKAKLKQYSLQKKAK